MYMFGNHQNIRDHNVNNISLLQNTALKTWNLKVVETTEFQGCT